MNTYEFREALKECRLAIFDLDGTLVSGRTADGIGKRFLKRELKEKHYSNVIKGAINYPLVLAVTSLRGEAAGLQYFAKVLFGTGCADMGSIKQYAKEYIEKHEIPGARDFIDKVHKTGLPKASVISTTGFDEAAVQALFYFNACNAVGNEIVYDKPNLISDDNIAVSLQMDIRTGHDKSVHTLGKPSILVRKYIMVGDSESDHELMRNATLAAASPLADKKTRELADIWIPDYRDFLEEMEKLEKEG